MVEADTLDAPIEVMEGSQAQSIELNDAGVGSTSDVDLVEASFEHGPTTNVEQPSSPISFAGDRQLHHTLLSLGAALRPEAVKKRGIAVVVPPAQRPWECQVYEEPEVGEILEVYDDGEYLVKFQDDREEVMTIDQIKQLDNGANLLTDFNYRPSESDSQGSVQEVWSSGDELAYVKSTRLLGQQQRPRRRSRPLIGPCTSMNGRDSRRRQSQLSLLSMALGSSDEDIGRKRRGRPGTRIRAECAPRSAAQKQINYSDVVALKESVSEGSENEIVRLGKRKRVSNAASGRKKLHLRGPRQRDTSPLSEEVIRRSGRNVRSRQNMRKTGEDNIPKMTAANTRIKYVGAKESFKPLPEDDDFRLRHSQTCDTCFEADDNDEKGMLVYCQGCTLSYHQKCLGFRNSREHLVTKITEKDFVLQCRRCISLPKQKDPLAPDQGLCFCCHEPGNSTSAFRERKSNKEEQKDREENDGEDPITDVTAGLINNHDNIMFRCMVCYRACHMHHLPPRGDSTLTEGSEEQISGNRFLEYRSTWSCKDCFDAPAEVESLVAWRPINIEIYEPGSSGDDIAEDLKEYLIKWKKLPYSKVQWMPGGWVWGVTTAPMRKAFAKRDNSNSQPKMTTEEAVPEDYHRVDIVLDVEYKDLVRQPTEKVAKARIKEVTRILAKFKSLGYEGVVWAEPPNREDKERWADFQAAYDDWVMGSFIRQPEQKVLRAHLAKILKQDFEKTLVMKDQPETLTGGKLMEYQLEGLNWLYYQWYKRQNAILADEMGLGKTIQVIGFLAALKQLHGCWPFLIVGPNSTCPNWRREIKKWAPSLRVVTYYGSAEAKNLSYKYELFPKGNKDLSCHVVVTSYDTAQDDDFRKVFRGVHWAGLIVDEGQRLKNDKNLLYGALNALKPPFKLLLTGTPLQNNKRELFNLLQFLDPSLDAEQMDEKYAELTKQNVAELHEKLREFFLRRTKVQVLKFLPSMAQIILPVSMTALQKKLYKSIIAKNPELIKSIMGTNQAALGKSVRTNLNNILMELRKCLCHPYVYSDKIEERSSNPALSHKGLVEASSKLQLLEIMLPKLKERGHRVLIFSQFLDMLNMVEDFLDGLGLFYHRLDGSVSSLQRQKRIDEFNAPNSPFFAFLLSTRAGGMGINLATADTVIILDPDFNPHQDIQALSRAHRIGQGKKVLAFQLTTRASAEEKILQIGKKKMTLDHVIIEQMDSNDDAGMDLESILRHGTEALFKDDESENIKYDSASVDKLLDRSQIEDTQIGEDQSAESQFSFARVWVNDKGTFEDGLQDSPGEANMPDTSVWDAILKEREREAAEEAAKQKQDFGRGRRKRQAVDYANQTGRDLDTSPAGSRRSRGRRKDNFDSDTDFQEHESEDFVVSGAEGDPQNSVQELDAHPTQQHVRETPQARKSQASPSQASPVTPKDHIFKRAKIPLMTAAGVPLSGTLVRCIACGNAHEVGCCPLKLAGTELCGLCGLPHFAGQENCAHLNSLTQLQAMLVAIKQSPEPDVLKKAARAKVKSMIADLSSKRAQQKEKWKQGRNAEVKETPALQWPDSTGQHKVNGVNGV